MSWDPPSESEIIGGAVRDAVGEKLDKIIELLERLIIRADTGFADAAELK